MKQLIVVYYIWSLVIQQNNEEAMAYDLALAAGKKLSVLGDKQLAVGEEKYGSGDEYIQKRSLDELVDYGLQRIVLYLENIKTGKGNSEALLGDCENHLRFILAKLEEAKKTSG